MGSANKNRMGSSNNNRMGSANKNRQEEQKEPARTGAKPKGDLGSLLNTKPMSNNRSKPSNIP